MIDVEKEKLSPYRQALLLLDMIPGPRWVARCVVTGASVKHYDKKRAVEELRAMHMQSMLDCDDWLYKNR